MRRLSREKGCFPSLHLLDFSKQVLSRNLSWLPDAAGQHLGLQRLALAPLTLGTRPVVLGRLATTLSNPAGAPVPFSIAWRW
jgi:mannosylglycoprotein endo-beta-mannosidase